MEKGEKQILADNNPRMERIREVTSDDFFVLSAAQHYTEELALDVEELFIDPAVTEAFEKFRYEAHVFEGMLYFHTHTL